MKYNWNKATALHRINAHQKTLASTDNEVLREKLEKEIAFYQNILEYSFYPTASEILLPTKINKVDAFNKDYQFMFSNEAEAFGDFIRDFYERVKDFKVKVPHLKRVDFSEDDLLGLTREFFWEQGRDIYGKFIEFFWGREDNLRFYNACILRPRNVSFVSPIAGNAYLAASRRKDISDLFTTINCYARAISTKMSLEKAPSKRYLSEVGPIFWELVSIDFMHENLDYNDEIEKFQLDHFKSMQQSVDFVRLKEKELKTVPLQKYSTPTILEQVLPRTISYLIALELYYIYLEDQKLAFELLNKIILLDQDSALTYLEQIMSLGITPLKSLDNEIMSLDLKRKP